MDVPTFPAPPSLIRDLPNVIVSSATRHVTSGQHLRDVSTQSLDNNCSWKRHGQRLTRLNNSIHPFELLRINHPTFVTELSLKMTERQNDDDDTDVVCAAGNNNITTKIIAEDLGADLSEQVSVINVKSIGIQTRKCDGPYMLKVLPTMKDIIDQDDNGRPKRFAKFFKHLRFLGRLSLCQFGLAWLLTFWTVAGATAFYATEGPREREQVVELKNLQRDLAIGLATELRQLRASEEEMEPLWSNKVKQYVAKHEKLLLAAVNSGYGEGGDTANGQLWSFSGCILFAVSLITTLGFGAPVPRTNAGRVVAVVFAAVGIPAHFLLIFNLGLLLAVRLQKFAIKQKYRHDVASTDNPTVPKWVKVLPFVSIASYYLLGIIGFGIGRSRPLAACVLFPLDFTAAGGLGQTSSLVRLIYAAYLEVAVTIASVAVAILRVSATQSLTNIGLKYGLLIEV